MDLPTKQQPQSPPSGSNQPSCTHTFHPQTRHSPLPPLYIIPTLTSFHRATIRPSTLSKLTRALTTLGTQHTHSPSLTSDIVKLRKELESGMSKERRQAMQFYILAIGDQQKRAAAELYLARYKGFVLSAEGRSGFGLRKGMYGEGGQEDDNIGNAAVERGLRRGWKDRAASCGVM